MTTAAIQLGLAPEFDRSFASSEVRREDLDFWPTPPWLARAILRRGAPFCLSGKTILDAGAGLGVLGAEAEKLAAERGHGSPRITAVELHPGRAEALRRAHPTWEVVEADFFEWGLAQLPTFDSKGKLVSRGRSFYLILTNPPQKIGEHHVWIEWVSLCQALANPTGGQAFALGHDLLWTTRDRAAWWRQHPPQWYRPSPRRPSFSGDGATDGRVWAWWSWMRGPMPQMYPTRTELLEVEW